MATLAQLEDVFTQIETAADQVSVVRVLEGSSAVLASLHEEVGGVEGVEGVVERLREEMDKVDEVGVAINEGVASNVDEGAVDEELEELERVERKKSEVKEAEKTRVRLEELERLEKEAAAVGKGAVEQQSVIEGGKSNGTADAVMEDAQPTREMA